MPLHVRVIGVIGMHIEKPLAVLVQRKEAPARQTKFTMPFVTETAHRIGSPVGIGVKLALKNELTYASTLDIDIGVKNEWLALKRRIQRNTIDSAARADLMSYLGVDKTRISQWLTDSENAREPSAKYALRMLKWVERQERAK